MRDQKTYAIIGAAMEACPPSRAAQARRAGLGCGFLEAVYLLDIKDSERYYHCIHLNIKRGKVWNLFMKP